MKYIIIALTLIFTPYHAQAAMCDPVTKDTADVCCSGVQAGDQNAYNCFVYNGGTQYGTQGSSAANSNQTVYFDPSPITPPEEAPGVNTSSGQLNTSSGAFPTGHDPIPGTINSLPTGAINDVAAEHQDPIVATPASGSSQLAQCSSIKFLSLLDILIWIKCIIVIAIIPLIFTAALAFFLWGVMKFIAASDSTKKKEGKNFMIAGLIGLFVMTSLWGLINIVSNTLGTGSVVPVLQTSSLKKK